MPWRAELPAPSAPSRAAELEPPPPPAEAPVSVPQEMLQPGATFTLAQVVEIALESSPQTRAAYHAAKSAAASAGKELAAYYPRLDIGASGRRADVASPQADNPPLTSYGADLSLSWLLFDLGGRAANAEEARLALLAADWSHDAVIRDVVLAVQEAYFSYLNAKAQLAAAESAVVQAKTALEAATGRHDAGVATIAEVLQARTALSQAELVRLSAGGSVMTLRGALATAMGLPATVPLDVGSLPAELPLERAEQAVEPLVASARARRPELAAARLLADKATAGVDVARSDGLPSLSLSASAGPTWYVDAPNRHDTGWSAGLMLSVPVFNGFTTGYNVERAREDAAVAAENAASLEQQVVLEVWTSYYALQTAGQQVKTSRDLLASAEQSQEVALGRYREGVGTILDLLTAQSALAAARAQEAQSRADWLAAAARLAHDASLAGPIVDVAVTTEEKTTP